MNKTHILRIASILTFILSTTFCSSGDKKEETPPSPPPQQETTTTPPPTNTTEEIDAKKAKEDASTRKDTDVAVVEEPKKFGSGESETEPPATPSLNYGELFDELSAKIKEIRYPDGETIEGFEYKRWDIPNQKDFINWLKTSASVIRDVLEKLPESVKLEIIGHADTTGPETREGNKLGNIYYSKKRADEVKKYIIKVFKSEKVNVKNLDTRIITKGVGSSEPIPGIEGTSPKNRRVTFNIIDLAPPSSGGKSGEADSDLDSTK